MDAARCVDELLDWWDAHRGLISFALGGAIAVVAAVVLAPPPPPPPPEVQGPPMPAELIMLGFQKVTTTVCRSQDGGQLCIVRETLERKNQP